MAGAGGGIVAFSQDLTLNNCILTGNDATGAGGLGGGIAVLQATGSLELLGGVITNNQADADGGGIYLRSIGNFLSCTIFGNHADDNGGGLSLGSGASATIAASTIAGDTASNASGGADHQSSCT